MSFENLHTKYRARGKTPGAGELARLIREDNLTVDELAAVYGASPSTVSQILTGAGYSAITGGPLDRTPKVDVLAELAKTSLVPQGDWVDEALCAQTDSESFFPEKGGSVREAKKVCAQCPVAAECLEYALKNSERFGIWGGLSERERRALTRRAA